LNDCFALFTLYDLHLLFILVPTCPAIRQPSPLTGVITSPNFPSNYPDAVNCSWTIIRPATNYKIIFKFSVFSLADSCSGDYLRFYRKKDFPVLAPTHPSPIKTFCGNSSSNFAFSEYYDVIVNFYSNSVRNGKGFHLTYTFVQKPYFTLSLSAPTSVPLPTPTSSSQRE